MSSTRARYALLIAVAGALTMIVGGCPVQSDALDLSPPAANGGAVSTPNNSGVTSGNGTVVAGASDSNDGFGTGGGGGEPLTGPTLTADPIAALVAKSQSVLLELQGRSSAGAPVEFLLDTGPLHGNVVFTRILDPSSGEIRYTPDPGFVGVETFSFFVATEEAQSEPATVTIVVHPQMLFAVEPQDGPRDLNVRVYLYSPVGDPLPSADCIWKLGEDRELQGPMQTHSDLTHTFHTGGKHLVRLTLMMSGLSLPIACSSTLGSEAEITVWPRVSGFVLDGNGAPVAGVQVLREGTSSSVVTDAQGRFSVDVPYNWTGSLIPSAPGMSFNPPAWHIANVDRDVASVNFTAGDPGGESQTITLSGVVRDNSGVPLAGVSLAASSGQIAISSADGSYTSVLPRGWSGVMTPSLLGYTFLPAARQYSSLNGNFAGQDYTATAANHPTNNPPTAIGSSAGGNEDESLSAMLMANDPDGDPLDFTVISLPSRGTLRDAGNGALIQSGDLPYTLISRGSRVTYTPNANAYGSDAITFRASDGMAASAPALISLVIQPMNDAPVVTQGASVSLTVERDSQASDPANRFTLSATDVDAAPSLSWSICSQPAQGSAQVVSGSPSSSGGAVTISYQPPAAFVGSTSFQVCVNDGLGGSASVNVAVTVAEPTPAQTYFVDTNNPNANDTNAGTAVAPFKTISRAVAGAAAGDTIYVKAGTYREQVTITKSGTSSRRILLRNYQNDRVVIDGENTRGYCIVIGRNVEPGDAGSYVTVEGFICKNPQGIHMPGAVTDSAGIYVLGTQGAIIRKCTIFRDDYPGYPIQPAPLTHKIKGIFVTGPAIDTIIEYNYVHHTWNGIGTRIAVGDLSGAPLRPIIRFNHVSHINIDDVAQQNNAGGVGFSNGTVLGTASDNLIHHSADNGIGTDDTAGHLIERNIVYLSGANAPGGNGPGIKLKQRLLADQPGDVVRYNVAFLCKLSGFEVNQVNGNVAAKVYNNTSFGNQQKGFTITAAADINSAPIVKNNVGVGNVGQDIKYFPTQTGVLDYNFAEDGVYNPALSPHTRTGNPGLANLSLLTTDNNSDGTPDFLDTLNDPDAFPDAASAISFARQQIQAAFWLQAGSAAIDAGVSLLPGLQDMLEHACYDDPAVSDPWTNDGDPGVVDMGALERVP